MSDENFSRLVEVNRGRGRGEGLERVQAIVTSLATAGTVPAAAAAAAQARIDHEIRRASLLLADGTFAAYQCAGCSFGPIVHAFCHDLRAHHGQNVGDGVVINNACPNCQWFSAAIADWTRWDGSFHAAYEEGGGVVGNEGKK